MDNPTRTLPKRSRWTIAAVALLVSAIALWPATHNSSQAESPASGQTESPTSSAGTAGSNGDVSVGATRSKPLPTLDQHNQIVFAPLDDPTRMTRIGSTQARTAWSTSKVLVVLAYIDTVADKDPAKLTRTARTHIKKALNSSDMGSLLALRNAIPGGAGAPMTRILRSIGDTHTPAWPNTNESSHPWSPGQQVRFMAALHRGDVVSPEASAYVLNRMTPVDSQQWGLGTLKAPAFKGGWVGPGTVTRQMGIYRGYSVAIITDGEGPVVLQSDGDYAHEKQLNKLALILDQYLDAAGAEPAHQPETR